MDVWNTDGHRAKRQMLPEKNPPSKGDGLAMRPAE